MIVPKLASRTVTAHCPKGEHVSFGGVIDEFKPPPKTSKHPIVFPTAMHRNGSSGWTVAGQSEAFDTGSRLTAVAYCDRGSVPSVATSSARLGVDDFNTTVATCPTGTIVVGGGYSSGSSSATNVSSSVASRALRPGSGR